MDLFMSQLTQTQQLNLLKDKYAELFEAENNGAGKFRIIKGDKKNFGNCVLLILPFVSSAGFMNANYEKNNLIGALEHYNIDNYVIVYAQPSKALGASRKLIKTSRSLMYELIEIVSPKMIVAFDDSSAELFLTQKPNIVELHGKEIHRHYGIPVYLTYNMDYYDKRTGYEDKKYKNSIFFEDWGNISTKYKELINAVL